MFRAEVRDGYVWLIDTGTGAEQSFYSPEAGRVQSAQVTGDDEVTIETDMYGGSSSIAYRISTGMRA